MRRNFWSAAVAALVSSIGLGAASAAQAADYRFLISWDQNYPMRKLLVEPFIKRVDEASKGTATHAPTAEYQAVGESLGGDPHLPTRKVFTISS